LTRILINVNEQITASMMEKHFLASSLQATVTAAPKDMMLEILHGCRIDVVAYYAEQIENNELLSFFNDIKTVNPNIRCILFLKKENMNMLGEELENYLDECITIPLDSSDFMIRLRRMIRTIEQKPAQPEEQRAPQIAPQAPASVYAPEQVIVPVAIPSQQPAAPVAPQASIEKEQPVFWQNPVNDSQPVNVPVTIPDESYTRPINTNYSYAPESYQQPVPAQTVVLAPQDVPQYQTMANNPGTPVNNQTQDTGNFQAKQFIPVQNYSEVPEKSYAPQKTVKKQQSIAGKIFSVISKVFFGLLILIIAVMAFFMVKSKLSGGTPSFAGYQFYGVLSGSMKGKQKTSFNTGDMVFVKYKNPKDIVVGDIITFKGLGSDSPLTTHRVIKVNKGDILTFTTQGDANNVADPTPVAAERVIGTVRGHLPFLGYLTNFAATKPGLIFLIFIPGGLVIIYETVNVFKVLKTERKKEKMTGK